MGTILVKSPKGPPAMYVCVCAQVSEAQWKSALEQCENDWLAASSATGAGLGCGGCRVFIRALAQEHAGSQGESRLVCSPCPLPVLVS